MTRTLATEAVERALTAVAAREAEIHAWAFLDPERARREAHQAPEGLLYGLTLGVKDIFDTADQPTEYGSLIYTGHRPRADAAVVAVLRAAGAVVLGKTVTAELAWATPGPTTNPHRVTHTPGGSSSGSAAAVAAGMVDLALGTQTAGSIIRPASFCGVFGLKPTFGLLPTAGMKQIVPSLDTVGLLAGDLDILERAWTALSPDRCHVPARLQMPHDFALVRTELWDSASGDCQRVVERAAAALEASTRPLPASLVGLADEVPLLQAYEGARSLAWERVTHPGILSSSLRRTLQDGDRIPVWQYMAVGDRAAAARSPEALTGLFGEADVLVTPAVAGEAPEGLTSTGSPRFNRLWTLLGLPTLNVPAGSGETGLPIGVQLVARPYEEWQLLRGARHLRAALAGSRLR